MEDSFPGVIDPKQHILNHSPESGVIPEIGLSVSQERMVLHYSCSFTISYGCCDLKIHILISMSIVYFFMTLHGPVCCCITSTGFTLKCTLISVKKKFRLIHLEHTLSNLGVRKI